MNVQFIDMYFVLPTECRTSLTDDGGKAGRHYGQLDTPCKFPFKVKDKMYYTCTYDYSHLTGNKPWCSVDTDENNKHHSGRDRIVVNGTSKKFNVLLRALLASLAGLATIFLRWIFCNL